MQDINLHIQALSQTFKKEKNKHFINSKHTGVQSTENIKLNNAEKIEFKHTERLKHIGETTRHYAHHHQ